MNIILFYNPDQQGESILRFLKDKSSVQIYPTTWGTAIPEDAHWWKGDVCISYNSRWIIPPHICSNARIAAINFHPGPPEYPGVGCVNWALYDNASEFGVTCHFMEKRVDSGGIVSVTQFPVYPSDTVESLLELTYAYQRIQFFEVMGSILSSKKQPDIIQSIQWKGKARNRNKLNSLAWIVPGMSEDEITRIIRATRYKNWQPYTMIHGYRFELVES